VSRNTAESVQEKGGRRGVADVVLGVAPAVDVKRGVPAAIASLEASFPAVRSGLDVDQRNPGDARPEGSPNLDVVPVNPDVTQPGGKYQVQDADPNEAVVGGPGNLEAKGPADPGSGGHHGLESAPVAAEADVDPVNPRRPARFE